MTYNSLYKKLEEYCGAYATQIRHELYFTLQKHGLLLGSLALFYATLRDVFYLKKHHHITPNKYKVIICVTLPGHSGWGTIDQHIGEITKYANKEEICIVKHFRLNDLNSGLPETHIGGVSIRDIIKALIQNRKLITKSANITFNLCVYLSKIRHDIWVSSWKNSGLLESKTAIFLCHNDFDIMSSAGISSTLSRNNTFCIQHGIPTEEFFPTNAKNYFVWGPSSEKTFKNRMGNSINLLALRPTPKPKAKQLNSTRGPIKKIAFISQSHTPIYGKDLGEISLPYVQHLAKKFPPTVFKILMHPGEKYVNPYSATPETYLTSPPHEALSTPSPKHLVIGCSSTALIDAALLGHYVLGINFEPVHSLDAYEICKPRHLVENPLEILTFYEKLNSDPTFEAYFVATQNEWLQDIFYCSSNNQLASIYDHEL